MQLQIAFYLWISVGFFWIVGFCCFWFCFGSGFFFTYMQNFPLEHQNLLQLFRSPTGFTAVRGLRSLLEDKISPHSLEVSAVTRGYLICQCWIFNLEKNGWKFPVVYDHNPQINQRPSGGGQYQHTRKSLCFLFLGLHIRVSVLICTHIFTRFFNHVRCVYMNLYVANMNKLQKWLLSAILDTTTWGMCSLISRVLQMSS